MLLLKNKSVFIVEDNIQNRTVFKTSLVREGATVTFERWGRAALMGMRQVDRIDLIVLDLMLAEGVSGFNIFSEIRAQSNYNGTPIVAVSAMDFAIAAPKVRSLGFDGFISKPIDCFQFPKQLIAIMGGEHVWC